MIPVPGIIVFRAGVIAPAIYYTNIRAKGLYRVFLRCRPCVWLSLRDGRERGILQKPAVSAACFCRVYDAPARSPFIDPYKTIIAQDTEPVKCFFIFTARRRISFGRIDARHCAPHALFDDRATICGADRVRGVFDAATRGGGRAFRRAATTCCAVVFTDEHTRRG